MCFLVKTSRPVNSKSGKLPFSISLRFFAWVLCSLLWFSSATTVVSENHPDVGGKPDQMTLGVPFHYGDGRESTAESVAIPPVCKRQSVFFSLCFLLRHFALFFPSCSSSFRKPLCATEQFSFCFSIFIIFFFPVDLDVCIGRKINGTCYHLFLEIKLVLQNFS